MKCASPTPPFPNFLPRPLTQVPYPAHHLEQEARDGSPAMPSEVPVVPWMPQESWRKQRGTTRPIPGRPPRARPHLQDGGALLVLVHLGGQPVELEGHAAQVREELAWSGSSAHTLRVVSRRCRCSIRVLSSWGRGPSSWGWRVGADRSSPRSEQASPAFLPLLPHSS